MTYWFLHRFHALFVALFGHTMRRGIAPSSAKLDVCMTLARDQNLDFEWWNCDSCDHARVRFSRPVKR